MTQEPENFLSKSFNAVHDAAIEAKHYAVTKGLRLARQFGPAAIDTGVGLGKGAVLAALCSAPVTLLTGGSWSGFLTMTGILSPPLSFAGVMLDIDKHVNNNTLGDKFKKYAEHNHDAYIAQNDISEKFPYIDRSYPVFNM